LGNSGLEPQKVGSNRKKKFKSVDLDSKSSIIQAQETRISFPRRPHGKAHTTHSSRNEWGHRMA